MTFDFYIWFFYLALISLEFQSQDFFSERFITWLLSVSIYALFLHQFTGLVYCLYSTGLWSWLISLFQTHEHPTFISYKVTFNLLITFPLSSLPLLSPDFYLVTFSWSFVNYHFVFLLLFVWTHFYFEKGGSTPKVYLNIFKKYHFLITFPDFSTLVVLDLPMNSICSLLLPCGYAQTCAECDNYAYMTIYLSTQVM